jgi:cell division protein FtsI (penicillin-binding protein 3)
MSDLRQLERQNFNPGRVTQYPGDSRNTAGNSGRPPNPPRKSLLLNLANPRKRIRRTSIALVALFLIYSLQLVRIQIINGPELAAKSQSARLQNVLLPAIRGNINDVNGVPIATTIVAKNVTADQTLINDPLATARLLAPVLGLPVEQITTSLTGDKRFSYVAKRITPEKWKEVAELRIAGIFSEPTTSRVYPSGMLASSIVGYVGAEGRGLGGLEYGIDSQLAGVDGKVLIERVNGREIPGSEQQSLDPIDGLSVNLTIDRDIQAVAERALLERIEFSGASGGTVVVMKKNGEILALANAPMFDPNSPFATDDFSKRNSAVTDVFEPGSTSKVMTIAAVINEQAAQPTTPFTIGSSITRGGTAFKDHDEHGVIRLTLNGILAKSSNIGTIMASELIGQDKFYDYLKRFGMGELTGLKFPGESAGLLPDPTNPNKWSGTTFPTLAFGQGLSLNAIQAASVYATIANDGVRVQPKLISSYSRSDGTVEYAKPAKSVQVVSAQTAKTVREMLMSVVSDQGTAPQAQIPGYQIAGKTGTAQKYDDKSGGYSGYTASFIGFAPGNNPELVVAVMIHDPVNGHYGSTISGPVFKQVMTYALAHQKIPPVDTPLPQIPVTW